MPQWPAYGCLQLLDSYRMVLDLRWAVVSSSVEQSSRAVDTVNTTPTLTSPLTTLTILQSTLDTTAQGLQAPVTWWWVATMSGCQVPAASWLRDQCRGTVWGAAAPVTVVRVRSQVSTPLQTPPPSWWPATPWTRCTLVTSPPTPESPDKISPNMNRWEKVETSDILLDNLDTHSNIIYPVWNKTDIRWQSSSVLLSLLSLLSVTCCDQHQIMRAELCQSNWTWELGDISISSHLMGRGHFQTLIQDCI